ncbi:glycosyltransferase family 2 protein [Sulfurimonas sp. SWIR-19]|uniref:glycosyltransferase family 2 protein n=1 Tax=Sulfurimonas sp. SWIR-19 TaxID=2878390 RepID=UPI001CF4C4A1|nr:glycosyltransferase family 2 protein [Sulfurimonas sp. SWIR-19]UCN00605.1 glycosyltransferase family 2 protein [Sulfurimonas sp. SWIR-19]
MLTSILSYLKHYFVPNTKTVSKTVTKKQTSDFLLDEINIKVSIVVVTYNNLALTKACLQSMQKYNNYDNCEIIVVDNMSQKDNTREFLLEYEQKHENVKVILNDKNGGFSYGNNIGIKEANGEIVILLNNDTYVTPDWIRRLVAHFYTDENIGMVGPRTNNIGNEAKIDIKYDSMDEMIRFAQNLYEQNKMKQYKDIKALAFFCVAIKKELFDKIGLLDEAFGIGMFEDDDFCERAKIAGYKLICADDVYIHHHLGATFDQEPPEWKQNLFKKNKAIYESKHGKWIPHKYRKNEK